MISTKFSSKIFENFTLKNECFSAKNFRADRREKHEIKLIFESFLKLEKIALVPPYVFAQIFEKFSKKNIRGDQGKNLAIDYVIMGGG